MYWDWFWSIKCGCWQPWGLELYYLWGPFQSRWFYDSVEFLFKEMFLWWEFVRNEFLTWLTMTKWGEKRQYFDLVSLVALERNTLTCQEGLSISSWPPLSSPLGEAFSFSVGKDCLGRLGLSNVCGIIHVRRQQLNPTLFHYFLCMNESSTVDICDSDSNIDRFLYQQQNCFSINI